MYSNRSVPGCVGGFFCFVLFNCLYFPLITWICLFYSVNYNPSLTMEERHASQTKLWLFRNTFCLENHQKAESICVDKPPSPSSCSVLLAGWSGLWSSWCTTLIVQSDCTGDTAPQPETFFFKSLPGVWKCSVHPMHRYHVPLQPVNIYPSFSEWQGGPP